MWFQQKIIWVGLVWGVFLIVFITGCSSVQDIIPSELDPPLWYLSPSGDKLLYNIRSDPNQAIVRLLATSQEFTITDCPRFSWLDDENVYCYDYHDLQYFPSVVMNNISSNVGDLKKISIKAVTTAQVKLDILLKQAKTIHRLQPSLTGPDAFLILDTEPQTNSKQYYYVTGIENLDEALKNYNFTTIPLFGRDGEPFKKIYSPNKKYYYLLQDNLGIYDAANNQLLAEFKPSSDYKSYFRIGGDFPNKSGGWAADSSGVYFQVRHSSGFGSPLSGPPIEPVQKLCVPGVAGCSAGK